jgi:hypothetical protein
MNTVAEYYPEYKHQFYYNNASTHLKCPPTALSAHHMPKNIPKPGKNWLVEVLSHNTTVRATLSSKPKA